MRGCVTKRKNKWAFIVEIGKHPETGRRRQKWFSGFDTKAQAEAELAKVLVQMGQGKTIHEPTKELIESYFTSWLQQKKQQVRPSTYTTYSWVVNYHIIPRFGYVRLSKLTPQNILAVYDKMLDDGLAPQTVKHVHKILHDGIETAVSWGMIEKNVVKLVKCPKVPKKELQVWDEKQLAKFLKEFKNERYHTLFLLAATTGMRRGELLGLKWADIDLKKATLSVSRAYVRGYKGYIFQEPKTAAGRRTITLPKVATVALQRHRKWQLADRLVSDEFHNYGLVFCKRNGEPLTPQQVEGVWYHHFKKNSSLPYIRIHDLRHTHASLLLKAGVHPKVVSERLGHSSVTITLDRYSHLLPGLQEAAAEKINNIMNVT